MSPSWTRLIRFVAAETSEVHIGQPVDPNLDVGLASHLGTPIQAYQILGSALDPAAQLTQTVLTVKHLLSPLSRSEVGYVRCLGLNYRDHAEETNSPLPTSPILFVKPPTALIGPNAPIVIPRAAQPPQTHLPDYEVELAVIIGRAAKNVTPAHALSHVLGYTAANDVSFRKLQTATSQWTFSKGFDDTTPLGPCLVSPSLVTDPQALALGCTLNATEMQRGCTADQIFTVAQTIASLSQGSTLLPGTVILTGTPKGVGFVRSPEPVYLKHGDVVSVWVGGGIGTMVNPVREEGWARL